MIRDDVALALVPHLGSQAHKAVLLSAYALVAAGSLAVGAAFAPRPGRRHYERVLDLARTPTPDGSRRFGTDAGRDDADRDDALSAPDPRPLAAAVAGAVAAAMTGAVADPVWARPPDPWTVVQIHAVGGTDAGRVWALGPGVYTIGSAPDDTVVIGGQPPDQSTRLTVTAAGQVWLALPESGRPGGGGPASGLRLNPIRCFGRPERPDAAPDTGAGPDHPDDGARRWPDGADLIGDGVVLRLVLAGRAPEPPPGPAFAAQLGPERVPADPSASADDGWPAVIRYPAPPKSPAHSRPAWPVILTPLLVGLGPGLVLPSAGFLWLTALTPLLAVVRLLGGRSGGRGAFWDALTRYAVACSDTEEEIRAALLREWRTRCDAAADPASAALAVLGHGPGPGPGPGPGSRPRRAGAHAGLPLRVGTVNQLSYQRTADPEDGPGDVPARWILPDVPYCVDLAACGVLGVGGDAGTAHAVARWLVLQAALRSDPRSLRIHLLADPSTRGAWDWLGAAAHAAPHIAPHAGPPEPGIDPEPSLDPHPLPHPHPMSPIDPESAGNGRRVAAILSVIDTRAEAARTPGAAAESGPEPPIVHLVVLDGASRLRAVDGVARILSHGPARGVYVLCIDTPVRRLPDECRVVIACEPGGLAVRGRDIGETSGIRPDLVTPEWCERVAGALPRP